MSKDFELAKHLLMFEEGWRDKAYYCTEGYPTIGWGFKVGEKGDPLPKEAMSHTEGNDRLTKIIKQIDADLQQNATTKESYAACDEARQAVLISMCYQLGMARLCGFKNALAAIAHKDWIKASKEMLDSLAARQTPARWNRAAAIMRTGVI